jgi:hypothetical protein
MCIFLFFFVVFRLLLRAAVGNDVYISWMFFGSMCCGGYEMLRLQDCITQLHQVLIKCTRVAQTEYYIARFLSVPVC